MAEQKSQSLVALDVILNTIRAEEYQRILTKSLTDPKRLDAFTEATAAAIRSNPAAFFDCDKTSLYNSILEAARRGVLPDGKQGALVTFNTNVAPKGQKEIWVKKAQFMIMPAGIIEAFAKVGIRAYAQSVYENDQIELWSDDTGQHVRHRYNAFEDRGKRIGAYAAGVTRDQRPYVEAMSMNELERARKKSKSPDKGPWVEWPERMEQKSALHRLDKRMPGAGILGDDDAEPERVVSVPESESEVKPETNGDSGEQSEVQRAISDDSKRPRGLQAIIDSEPAEPVPVERGRDESHIEESGGAPF